MAALCMRNNSPSKSNVSKHILLEDEEKDDKKKEESTKRSIENEIDDGSSNALTPILPSDYPETTGRFKVGDHVYSWSIPGVSQTHGIVVMVTEDEMTVVDCHLLLRNKTPKKEKDDKTQHDEATATENGDEAPSNHIQEENPQSPSYSVEQRNGSIREGPCQMQEGQNAQAKGAGELSTWMSTSRTDLPEQMKKHAVTSPIKKSKWNKVIYSAGWFRRFWQFSGTITSVSADPPGLVLARVSFLLENPEVVPAYHSFMSNSECVAVWCMTGRWATLQTSSFLHLTAAGQVKSAATVAAYVSVQQVTVPSAGVWGWMGFTHSVSLVSTQPYLLPAIAGYGIVTVGGPIWMLHRYKKNWEKTTDSLHEKFWAEAIARPDVFVDCITHWSDVHS